MYINQEHYKIIMLINFFLVFFIGAIATLYGGYKFQRWLLCMGSTILWAVLAFQAFKIEVVTGGVVLVFQEVILVLFCWFMTFAATGLTLIGAVNERSGKRKEQPGV
jgi:hypothetical protein